MSPIRSSIHHNYNRIVFEKAITSIYLCRFEDVTHTSELVFFFVQAEQLVVHISMCTCVDHNKLRAEPISRHEKYMKYQNMFFRNSLVLYQSGFAAAQCICSLCPDISHTELCARMRHGRRPCFKGSIYLCFSHSYPHWDPLGVLFK